MVTFETRANLKMEEMLEHIECETQKQRLHRSPRKRVAEEFNVEEDGVKVEKNS